MKQETAAPANTDSVQDTYADMKDWFVHLERSVAGYSQLSGALATIEGRPEGRGKGLPILEMPASADGHDAIRVVLDLKKLPQEHVRHVLVPLIHMQARDVLDALGEVERRFELIRDHYAAVLGPAAPAATAQAALHPNRIPSL